MKINFSFVDVTVDFSNCHWYFENGSNSIRFYGNYICGEDDAEEVMLELKAKDEGDAKIALAFFNYINEIATKTGNGEAILKVVLERRQGEYAERILMIGANTSWLCINNAGSIKPAFGELSELFKAYI